MDYNCASDYCNNLFNYIMKKINLAITGCMGRMGQQLIKSAIKDKSTKLVALTENRSINKKISGIRPELNTEKALGKANVCLLYTSDAADEP